MRERIKFALSGFGHIGRKHAEAIMDHPDCELVAVCDFNEASRIEIEGLGAAFFKNFDEMLSSDIKIDVVTVATPNGMHFTQAYSALEKGFHVAVEKPLCLTTADAGDLLCKATANNLKIFGVMQNRFSPISIELHNLVKGGKLGKIFLVQINCFWNRDERYYTQNSWHGTKDMDGGTLFTQFSHYIDMMYWLFGDIKNIRSRFENFSHADQIEFEDSGFLNFDFENGGVGIFNYSTSVWGRNLESTLTIIAENGTVKVAGQYMEKLEYCYINNYEI